MLREQRGSRSTAGVYKLRNSSLEHFTFVTGGVATLGDDFPAFIVEVGITRRVNVVVVVVEAAFEYDRLASTIAR